MRISRLILFPVLLLVCGLPGAAGNITQRFQHYTSADGLPSNCIRDIMQDEDGFMWFATDGGLSRFDGISFKTFVPENIRSTGHCDPFVSTIIMCGHRLWIATAYGLRVYDAEHERLVVPELQYASGCPTISGFIRRMAVDPSGSLWVAMDNGLLYCIEPSGSTGCYDVTGGRGSVNTVYVDKRGDVWATGSYMDSGLYRYDAAADCFKPVEVIIDGKQVDIRTMAIAEDDRNRLWIGQWDGTLVCFNPFTGRARCVAAPGASDIVHIHSVTPV